MVALALPLMLFVAQAGIREHPGGKELPSDPYIRRVSESESPVRTLHVRTKDGLYVAAVMRKPKGDGPFPALIFVHGWPGGREIKTMTEWSLGANGSPVLERFLQEKFVAVVADYRNDAPTIAKALLPIQEGQASSLDDCLAVVDFVRTLPFVDASRINLYGSSLGGHLVARMAGERKVHAAIIGGGVLTGLLGAKTPPEAALGHPAGGFDNLPLDNALARRNVEAIQCPVLLLVGQDDFLANINRKFYDLLVEAAKPVDMDFYLHAYHGFELGPGSMAGPGKGKLPLLEGTLDALERSVRFAKGPARYQ